MNENNNPNFDFYSFNESITELLIILIMKFSSLSESK